MTKSDTSENAKKLLLRLKNTDGNLPDLVPKNRLMALLRALGLSIADLSSTLSVRFPGKMSIIQVEGVIRGTTYFYETARMLTVVLNELVQTMFPGFPTIVQSDLFPITSPEEKRKELLRLLAIYRDTPLTPAEAAGYLGVSPEDMPSIIDAPDKDGNYNSRQIFGLLEAVKPKPKPVSTEPATAGETAEAVEAVEASWRDKEGGDDKQGKADSKGAGEA